MKTFIAITGTTGVGKSQVAIELAKLLDTQVISADSMQVYVGMDIGTAKVTENQKQGVVHHMLDVVQPNQDFSAHLYREKACSIIDNMQSLPIVAGGTGLYIQSLVYPPEFGTVSKEKRQELQDILKSEGLEPLQLMLKQLDEESYNTIDIKNPVRVLRAIEIAQSGGVLRSQGSGQTNPRYNCLLFVLETDRQALYQKINDRVDEMIEAGLVDEVKQLVEKYGYCNTSAFNAIGYKEIIAYLQELCTLEEAIEQIKINSRHYAKRQITYFKKMQDAHYLKVDGFTPKEIAKKIYSIIIGK